MGAVFIDRLIGQVWWQGLRDDSQPALSLPSSNEMDELSLYQQHYCGITV